MVHTPLFSVLIANYNNERYIIEAIDSVKAQTYDNWEIVILDDCSTNDISIIESHLSENIRLYRNDKNMGVGYTKDKLVHLSKGEICGFLDADDTLLPHALLQHVECFSNDKISIVYSGLNVCNEQLSPIYQIRTKNIPKGESLLSTMQFFAPTAFTSFRKESYLQTSGICNNRYGGDDMDLNFKLEEVGECVVIDSICYNWRTKMESLSHNKNLRIKCVLQNLDVISNACERRELDCFEYRNYYLSAIAKEFEEFGKREVYKTNEFIVGAFIFKPIRFIQHYIERNYGE